MRRGFEQDVLVETLVSKEGEIVALSLGGDHCAEHECGVSGIKRILNIPGVSLGCVGLKARTGVKGDSEQIALIENSDVIALFVDSYAPKYTLAKDGLPYDLLGVDPAKEPKGFVGAWDEDSFGVLVSKTKAPLVANFLRVLHTRLLEGGVAIMNLKSGAFAAVGLVLVLADHVPETDKEALAKADREKLEFAQILEESGIHDLLREAGKDWYSLSRCCRGEDGVLRVWLNPAEQRKYNFGWFTIDELREWAEGKGPIVRTEDRGW